MKKKFNVIEPQVRVFSYSTAPTVTTYISAIDWYFPRPKKSEHPGKYVGRVAKFMREWNELTLKEASAKYKVPYASLWRIEKGLWQSIKKTHNYLYGAYGLTMKFDFAPTKKPKTSNSKKEIK